MSGFRNRSAIAGIGWTAYTRNSGKSVEALAVEAAKKAIHDAGLDVGDIDGVVTYGLGDTVPTNVVATDLGLKRLRHYADYNAGGNMACGVILHAAMAVAFRLKELKRCDRRGHLKVRHSDSSGFRVVSCQKWRFPQRFGAGNPTG